MYNLFIPLWTNRNKSYKNVSLFETISCQFQITPHFLFSSYQTLAKTKSCPYSAKLQAFQTLKNCRMTFNCNFYSGMSWTVQHKIIKFHAKLSKTKQLFKKDLFFEREKKDIEIHILPIRTFDWNDYLRLKAMKTFNVYICVCFLGYFFAISDLT